MSADIKPGDLVMIVRSRECCGKGAFGVPFTAGAVLYALHKCHFCGVISAPQLLVESGDTDLFVQAYRLKKIDPPSYGESLPTRADVDQEVTA